MLREINEKSVYCPRQILVCFAQSIHISVPWPFAKEEKKRKKEEKERHRKTEAGKAEPTVGYSTWVLFKCEGPCGRSG